MILDLTRRASLASIRWIGRVRTALPAAKIGRAFRVKREDVDAMLALAQADSASLATRRDLWVPDRLGPPHRRSEAERPTSVWEIDRIAMPLSRRGE